MSSLVEFGPVILERKILSTFFRYFIIISPLNNHKSPSPKDALCQVWLKLVELFWRRFLNFVKEISVVRNYLPFKKRLVPFIQTNFIPLYRRMLGTYFGWHWPSGSGEEENVKSLKTDRLTDNNRSENLTCLACLLSSRQIYCLEG